MQPSDRNDGATASGPHYLGRLATACYRYRRRVVAAWIAALVTITALGFVVPGRFETKLGGGHPESQRAQSLLERRFPAQAGDTATVVFQTDRRPVDRRAVTAVLATLRALAHVAGVRGPFDAGAGNQLSRDGHVAYATIVFDRTTDDLPRAAIQRVIDRAHAARRAGFEVELGGAPIEKTIRSQPGSGEGVGLLAAVVILLVAFGSVIAMGLPIVTALFGVAISFALIDLLSHAMAIPTFGQELAAIIGIGVGIDYALLIVTRYRQALHEGAEPLDAVTIALSTAGRSVLFAGGTVVISVLGLFLIGLPFVYGLALGAVAAVVLVMAAALTLLPAVLGYAGRSIDRLHVPHVARRGRRTSARRTVAWRWSRVVQRRPVLAAGASLAVLLALALPLFSMRLAYTDAGNDPAGQTTRKAYEMLAAGFGAGSNGPLLLVVRQPPGADPAPLVALGRRLRATRGVAHVSAPTFNRARDTAVMTVIPVTAPQDRRTQQLVRFVRARVIRGTLDGSRDRAFVGGVTAAGIDSTHQFSRRLPYVVGAVVVLSFLLLMAVFRSIAVPLKAAVMNLLSVGAAYGVVVAVFQWGWLGSIVGIGRTAPVDPWVPLMLFTILFGLSMDYEVFLLSRVREEWLRTGDNATAVADGLAGTARVITAAAAIMVCVFGAFALGDVRVLKLFGVGMATAIFVDATLVRMVLVPATMELLGGANWWMPRWLDRVVPTISVDTPARVEPEPVLADAS
ncbi:MAG TPA: MMPL family transporter [Acidimicrobiia bacterium]|nr:MMPL family transporter [Acidimicrobiia bacterium]